MEIIYSIYGDDFTFLDWLLTVLVGIAANGLIYLMAWCHEKNEERKLSLKWKLQETIREQTAISR
jgi:hypothetical protein